MTRLSSSAVTILLALAPATRGAVIATSTIAALPTGTSTAKLNTAAQAIGFKYFGTATDNPELNDTAYTAILDDHTMFGQITAANSMKWDATEPSRGTFTFAAGDVIANLAANNGQLLRGHNCVWHNQLPSWVTSGGFNNATLLSIVQNHCSTLVSHYEGHVLSWDVINEPLNDDGTFRNDVFTNTTGTAYISTALRAARAADPNAKLYINEFNLEFVGPKVEAMQNLVKTLQSESVPIDGMGFQGHLIVGQVPPMATLMQTLEMFTSLGLEVAYTELDIRMTLPETAALLEQQKADYQTVISACKAVKGCVGVTLWDFTDKFSWIPGTFSGQGAACPWDSNLVRKPGYDGIVAGLQG